jgi:hypothetical protein
MGKRTDDGLGACFFFFFWNVAAGGVSPAPQNQKGFKKINALPIHQLLLQHQGSQPDLPPSPSIAAALSSSVLLDQQPSSLEYVQQQPKPKWISH